MPKVFEKDGYKFFFYSNEHRPIHVHVRRGDGEAVFNVEESVELRESRNMTVSELSKAQRLASLCGQSQFDKTISQRNTHEDFACS